ncbi:MAG: apolipoprotein N-acyltransferase [Thermodesulfobacteriota bacterium]
MNLLLILLSALLYILAFPGWDIGFFAFIALVPLFRVVESTRSDLRAIGYGALWGGLVSTGLGYWLLPALIGHFAMWPPKALVFYMLSVTLPACLIYASLSAAYRFVHHRHLAWYAFALPALWTLAEYLKEMVPAILPWGGIGYAALPFYRFVQMADLGGVHALTFVIAAINAVSWFILRSLRPGGVSTGLPAQTTGRLPLRYSKTPFAAVLVLLLAICLPVLYGSVRLVRINDAINGKMAAGRPLQAVLVQGNFDLDDRWSGMGFYRRLRTYLAMSKGDPGYDDESGKKEKGYHQERVIVWPETTLNEPGRMDGELFRQIMHRIGKNALLISGGLHKDTATGQMTNCAYLVSEKGTLMRYDKNILLPYAETSMVFDWLGAYYTAPSEFAAGRTPSFMDTAHGGVGVSICFEILYPRYIARSVASGGEFLVNISNDAWFGDSPMPRMHLNAARMRAIENRRFLLRAANSGFSAVISPDGRVAARTELFQRQSIESDFSRLSALSPYTRWGDWPVLFSGIVLGIALLRMVLKKEARP